MHTILNKWKEKIGRFFRDERGAVAIVYGPMVIVLLLFAGVAIDYARSYIVKKEISRALDAAVLAAGSIPLADEDEMREVAERFFNANLSQSTIDEYDPQITLEIGENDDVTVTSSANVATTLMRLANIDYVDVDARSVIGRGLVKLEVALVLDTTGSMRHNNKMEDMVAAAKKLIDTLYEPSGSEGFVQFAVVPFTASVNVGTQYKNASWMDVLGKSKAARDDYHPDHEYWGNASLKGMTAYEALDEWNENWKGCVRARVGQAEVESLNNQGQIVLKTMSLDLTDATPTPGEKNTYFAPYVHPINGVWGSNNPPSNSAVKDRLRKHYMGCQSVSILPLTNVSGTIKSKIDELNPQGYTSIPTGLGWGWRVLSSAEPFTQGVEYGEDETKKVIVVLTDGRNEVGSYESDPTEGVYQAYGMPGYNRLGTSTNQMKDKLNNKVNKLCKNIKAKNIIIYSITFAVNDEATQTMMRKCATKNENYFNSPSGEALDDAFKQIATGLQELQLKQ